MKVNINLKAIATAATCFVVSFAYAQEVKLNISAPKIIKAIEVTGEEVNLRKAPNSASQKLMRLNEPESDICEYEWGVQKRRGMEVYPATVYKGDFMAVIGETEDWYQVLTNYDYNIAYISKQFTKEAKITPVTPEMFANPVDLGGIIELPVITSGKYRGYGVVSFSDMDQSGITFGRIINGFLVCNHFVETFIETTEKPGRLVSYFEDGFLHIKAGRNVCRSYKDPEYPDSNPQDIFDASKLTEAEFKKLMEDAGVNERNNNNEGKVYACVNGKIVKLCDYDIFKPELHDRVDFIPAE